MAKSLRNCRVPCCNGQHFMKCTKNGWIMNVDDVFELYRHYYQNVKHLCDLVCSADIPCNLHKKLRTLKFFVDCVREKNLYRNIVVSKILVKECDHPFCFGWCFKIYVTKYLKNPDLKKRSFFL